MSTAATTAVPFAFGSPAEGTGPDRLEIAAPDDWHLHLRDGAALSAVVAASARQFRRAIVMPNLRPPVTTVAMAADYRERIVAALRAAAGRGEIDRAAADAFQPLMTLYLTEATTVAEIEAAKSSGLVHALKYYPAGATTNSDAGVGSIDRVLPVLAAMERVGLPLLIHGEVVDTAIDLFDREAVFIDRILEPLRRSMPGLRVVFEHITTREAAHYVRDAGGRADGGQVGGHTGGAGTLAATITAQHLLYNRNAIFTGGLRPHWYCLPVLKREVHRAALVEAATGGDPRYFLGTDSAPHARLLKEHGAGCAGCYTAPHALELYAMVFEAVGALDRFEAFASRNGPAFYRLPVNADRVVLERARWSVPESLPFGDGTIVPLAAGETLGWRLRG